MAANTSTSTGVTLITCPAGHQTACAKDAVTWCLNCRRYVTVGSDGTTAYVAHRLPQGAPVPYRRGPR